jgi:membrane associated rhomboid family serine protease
MVLPLGDVEKTQIVPWATYLLIALNVVVFVAQKVDTTGDLTVAYAATPYEITHNVDLTDPVPVAVPADLRPGDPMPRRALLRQAPGPYPIWLTLFTAMFLHGSPLHLAGNMLFLWIFGDNVEEVLGTFRYVLVYLACGLVGSIAQIVAAPDSLIPTLGASGAIAGVMGAYVVWFPHNRIRVLVFRFITEMPAMAVIGLWIVMQLWEGFGSLGRIGESGGVAYLAHVGGAVTGIAAAYMFHDRADDLRNKTEARRGWYYGPDEPDVG